MALVFLSVGGGLPDFGGAKVGAVRVWISDAMDDGEVAIVVEPLEALELGMQTETLGE
jgi:hypothetical protein